MYVTSMLACGVTNVNLAILERDEDEEDEEDEEKEEEEEEEEED